MNVSFGNCHRIAQIFVEKGINNGQEPMNIGNIINLFLNAISAVTATLGNGLIIVAILRSQNLQTPSYLLITSLAFTDLLVGLVLNPLQIVLITFFSQGNISRVCSSASSYAFFAFYLGSVSVMTVTCISIDRYLALTLKHRYTIIVTKKRVRILLVVVWILACLATFAIIFKNYYNTFSNIVFFCYLVLLLSICVFYMKCFRALRLYTVQVHAQQPNPLAGNFDVARYKKTLKTMLVVLACFLLCYFPLVCVISLGTILDKLKKESLFYFTSITLMYINSSINPVIYLSRFVDIRNACREMYRGTVN